MDPLEILKQKIEAKQKENPNDVQLWNTCAWVMRLIEEQLEQKEQ